MSNQDQVKFVLMPVELSNEAATKRANEQFEENSKLFKNLHRECTELEFSRLKNRWLENRVKQLKDQYREMVKAVGVTPRLDYILGTYSIWTRSTKGRKS